MPYAPKPKPKWWIPKRKQRTQRNNNLEVKKFYNSKEWKATRNYILSLSSVCRECEKHDLVVPAECVDHIVPITLGGSLLSEKNLQPLCNSCHAKKSSAEGRGEISSIGV